MTADTPHYVYLGDKLTDPALIGQPCSPVLRADGKCIVGRRPRNQLVKFMDGREVVVLARRLRLTVRPEHALPGDVPLAGAVDAVREAAWPGHDEVRGIEDE